MNAIPKEGGNTISGQWFTYYTRGSLQQDNRTPAQKELIRATDRIAYDYDTNPAVGGPIIEDKLWFFGAFQRKAFKNFSSDVFFAPEGSTSSTGADITYDHAGEQAFETRFYNSGLLRLTNQRLTEQQVADQLRAGQHASRVRDGRLVWTRPPEPAGGVE